MDSRGTGSRAVGNAQVIALPVDAPADVVVAEGRDAQIACFPTREQYHDLIAAWRADGCEMCVDLCAVDYLTHHDRSLPEGVVGDRFEIVVNLLSLSRKIRVRVRVQLPAEHAEIPTLFDLYPGTEAMEREAYDMFGVLFTGHPDLTRILMPEEWEGHPLRKDYGVGRVPVQFKAAPGPR